MLRVAYQSPEKEMLVDGTRADYDLLWNAVRQMLDSGVEAELPVRSTGSAFISHFVVRPGAPSNRVSVEGCRIIFSVATALRRQFLSFIEFPADSDLPDSPIQYHHHFDGLGGDGTYVATDSLPVVFGLERA